MALLVGLVVFLMAGCADGGPADAGTLPQETRGPEPTLLTNGLAAPLRHVLWNNGTIPTQDTCLAGGCILSTDRAFHVTGLDGHVPLGVPARLVLDVVYDPHTVAADGNEAWFEIDEGAFYSYTATFNPGALHVEATGLVRSGVRAVFATFSPGGGNAETPYALAVTIEAHPVDIPVGVPILVDGRPGDELVSSSPFRLYGPKDEDLGSFATNTTLGIAGTYVVLLPPDGPAANLTTTGSAKLWRAADLRIEPGAPIHLPFTGTVDGPWQASGTPLGVGILVRVVDGPAGPGLASVGFEVTLEDTQGALLSSGPQCGACLTFGGFGLVLATPLGDARAVAGDYTIHGESTFTADIEFVPFSIHVVR